MFMNIIKKFMKINLLMDMKNLITTILMRNLMTLMRVMKTIRWKIFQ